MNLEFPARWCQIPDLKHLPTRKNICSLRQMMNPNGKGHQPENPKFIFGYFSPITILRLKSIRPKYLSNQT